jgi:hypothetical protein
MPGAIPVSDFLSNLSDQVVNAAKLMHRSAHRQKVFETIYKGQKQQKSVQEIMKATGLSQIRVLDEGKKLGPLVEKIRKGFRKRKDLAPHYKRILAYARDPKKAAKVPTKVSPRVSGAASSVRIKFSPAAAKAIQITIDEIDAFAGSKRPAKKFGAVREEIIKKAFAEIIGEGGKFKDWGGEKSDLYTNRLKVKGTRRATAIAFKGRGTSGKLVPAKMGKNGDQIGRLFDEPADVFLIVYCGQIDSSVVSQLHAFAIAKRALSGQRAYFGVIDADDLGQIAARYPSAFKPAKRRGRKER